MRNKITSMVTVFALTVTMIPSIAFASGTAEQTEVSEGVLSCVLNEENTEMDEMVSEDTETVENASTGSQYGTYGMLRYKVNDNSVIITGFTEDMSGAIVIPEEIDGKTVVEIEKRAFFRSETITSVTIPATVKRVNENAFRECPNLTSATVAAAEIGDHAFYKDSGWWTDVNVLEGVQSIGDGNFSRLDMRAIDLPRSLEHIGSMSLTGNVVMGCYKDSYAYDFAVEKKWNYYIIDDDGTENFVAEKVSDVLSWKLDKKSGELNVYCEGELPPYKESGATWCNYSEYIGSLTVSDTCTGIAQNAFDELRDLREVTIGAAVESIGENAFYKCVALKSAVLPDGLKTIEKHAFRSCEDLEKIILPGSMESLGAGAFEECHSLKYAEIPGTIKNISTDAFWRCYNLEKAVIGEGVEHIGISAFSNCPKLVQADIPESVKCIERDAFRGCSSLASVDLSGNVQELGNSAFYGCESLTEVIIPDCMTTVPPGIFDGCSGLEKVVIPDAVTEIGASAFSGCTSLPSIDWPEALTVIREFAFANCDNLSEIAVPEGVTLIERDAFSGSDNLKSVKLPDTLETMEYGMFSGCTNLEQVNIPERITEIDSDMFRGCKSLKTVKLHDGIERIESYAFYESGIEDIEIPGSIKDIGYRAFSNCKDMISVKMNDGLMTLDGNVFEECSNLKTVTLGEGLEAIGYGAFYLCGGLEAITIPSTVNTIEGSAFYGCESLTEIAFKGFVENMSSNVFAAYNAIDADVYYYENIGWEKNIERIVFNAPKLTWIPVGHTHKFDSGKVTRETTCTAEGVFTYTCEDCKYKYNETLARTDHVIESVAAVKPTCTEDGNTAGERCSVCGEVFSGIESVPAAGHKFGEWVLTEISTCVSYGEQIRTCEVCGEAEKEKLPMTEHVTYSIPGVDATCSTEGYEEKIECILCGNVLKYDNIIPKLPHKHGRWIIEKDATCTESGLKYRVCECGDKITETIPATGHIEEIIPAEPGDCDSGDKSEGIKCSVCDEWLKEPWISDTPVHNYSSEYIICLPATMQKEGYKAKICINCGAVGEDIVAIPRIKSAVIANLIYNGKERTPAPVITNYYKNTKLKKGTDYTVVYKNANAVKVVKPKNVGRYTAVITFKGEYKGTVKHTFIISPKATVINKMTKPGKRQIKVTWQRRTVQVTGYQIQYSTTKNFTKKTTKTVKVKNFKTNTKTIKQLKANKKYWVKIRTYKNVNGKTFYSKWSPVKTIRTK